MSKNVIKTTEKTPELILTILHIASKCMDHFPPYFMFTYFTLKIIMVAKTAFQTSLLQYY